ncbi:MAG: sensor histidine kinase [Bacteroidota bacterium]|jgi:signal transduction histidine kinase
MTRLIQGISNLKLNIFFRGNLVSSNCESSEEFNRFAARYLRAGILIALVLNPLFGLLDYLTAPELFQQFMGIRLIVSGCFALMLAYLVKNNGKVLNIGFMVLSLVVIQDSWFFSHADLDDMQQMSLSFVADFVGAGLVLLWPIGLAFTFLLLLFGVNIFLYSLVSELTFGAFMANGGFLVAACAVFSMVMVVSRYYSLRAIMDSRAELLRSNKQMSLQNEIIRQKGIELQNSNSRLREFAHMVSHDLKTPLRGIRNLAGWMREDCSSQLNKEGRTHLDMMDRQIIKMENLIRDMLEYSKNGNLDSTQEWISLDDLIQEVIETVDVGRKTKFMVKSSVPVIKSTRLVVGQVLQNLLSNSIKHNDKQRAEVIISVSEEDGYVRFSISDNGPGIAPCDQSKVFRLFQTLGESGYESSGVGLPVAKKMVEDSGGSIWIESERGCGAVFHFTLPNDRIHS